MAPNPWAVPLQLSDFNITLAFLGGFLSLFGLVSLLLKDRYYLSEALISLVAGVVFGPNGARLIRPRDYVRCGGEGGVAAPGCDDGLDAVTLNFSRLVLGVQLVLAGVQLPGRYLVAESRSLLLLVGPGMACMWLTTSFLVWAVVGTPSLLHALAVGACVTPTDPVLSAVVVKGTFADQNIPRDVQDLVVAESGANDGLGYPFLFLALYLIKFVGAGSTAGGVGDALWLWLTLTWLYVVLLSVVYGAAVGLLGRELLHWAQRRDYVDRESFLVFSIALALLLLGTCGLVGTDDVLACFVAGNTFTWDDWFRVQTKDDSLQPTIDMLLNVTIFLWYGASLPWHAFVYNSVPSLSFGRLVVLGLLVLLLRRLPWILGMHAWIRQIRQQRQASFVGFFGPIGVSAIFYLFITLDFIDEHLSNAQGVARGDVEHLGETVVHGLSIPVGKMWCRAPRTLGFVLGEGVYGYRDAFARMARTSFFAFGDWPGRRKDGVMYMAAEDAEPDSPGSAGSADSPVTPAVRHWEEDAHAWHRFATAAGLPGKPSDTSLQNPGPEEDTAASMQGEAFAGPTYSGVAYRTRR